MSYRTVYDAAVAATAAAKAAEDRALVAYRDEFLIRLLPPTRPTEINYLILGRRSVMSTEEGGVGVYGVSELGLSTENRDALQQACTERWSQAATTAFNISDVMEGVARVNALLAQSPLVAALRPTAATAE